MEIEFLRASKNGNLEGVLSLLTEQNVNINFQNTNGLTALHLAAKEGHNDVVVQLLKRGINIDAITSKGNSALHIACLCGQKDVVETLLSSGADANLRSHLGFTALYMAAQEDHPEIVLMLLQHGADPSLCTNDGFSAIDVAKQLGNTRVVELLTGKQKKPPHSLSSHPSIGSHDRKLTDTMKSISLPKLHSAVKKNNLDLVAQLVAQGQNVDAQTKSGFSALHIACHYGHLKVAQFLVLNGADVNFNRAKNGITPLHVAAKWGFVTIIKYLIDEKASIESTTKDGLTPLHCAARFGKAEVIKLLLKNNADKQAKSLNGLTPLHMAVQGEFEDCVQLLIDHGADIEATTVDCLTPLHVAAHCGHVKSASVLLQNNCNPKAEAGNGFSPLHVACNKNRVSVVQLLLKYLKDLNTPSANGLTPVHIAAQMGHTDIIGILAENGADLNATYQQNETPLHLATRTNQLEAIKCLLYYKCNVNAQTTNNYAPLHFAVQSGNIPAMQIMLANGAKTNEKSANFIYPLHLATSEGNFNACKVLLENGADPDVVSKRGLRPLHYACKQVGNPEIAELLLANGAKSSSSDKNGLTPMHYASQAGNVKLIRLLTTHKADTQAAAKNGFTSLHLACLHNRFNVAEDLITNHQVDIGSKTEGGYTPLHLAAKEGFQAMVVLLLKHKAPIDACTKQGFTPLHLTAKNNHKNVAEVLLTNKCDKNPHSKEGHTPLHLAAFHGNLDIVKLLINNGVFIDDSCESGYTALHYAVQEKQTDVIDWLLKSGANQNIMNFDNFTPLSLAKLFKYRDVEHKLTTKTSSSSSSSSSSSASPIVDGKQDVFNKAPMKNLLPDFDFDSVYIDSEDEIESEKLATSDFANSFSNFSPSIMTRETDFSNMTKSYHSVDAPGYKYLPHETNFNISSLIRKSEDGDKSLVHESMSSTADVVSPTLSFDNRTILRPSQPKVDRSSRTSSMDTSLILSDDPNDDTCIQSSFLISFLVDARGKAMCGMRHSGVRIIVTPGKTCQPTRITCKLVNAEKLSSPPVMLEGEDLAARILKMGPPGTQFEGPVIIEVPYSASLRNDRRILILRSEDGITWKEHFNDFSFYDVQQIIKTSFGEDIATAEQLYNERVARIVTNTFPKYFALVSAFKVEAGHLGPSGGQMVTSCEPKVAMSLPAQALKRDVSLKMQVHPIPPALERMLAENGLWSSPVVTIEPRRRKFHRPISITLPSPRISSSQSNVKNLLLCSLTEGERPSVWEDITTKSSFHEQNERVTFETNASGNFWFLKKRGNVNLEFLTWVYNEMCKVPFFSKVYIFAKRSSTNRSLLKMICTSEPKLSKIHEKDEDYTKLKEIYDVEMISGEKYHIDNIGNVITYNDSDSKEAAIIFNPFKENLFTNSIFIKDLTEKPEFSIQLRRASKVKDDHVASFEVQLPPHSGNIWVLQEFIKKWIPGFNVKEYGVASPGSGGNTVLTKSYKKADDPNVLEEKIVETSPEAANLSEDNIEVTTQVREIREQLPDGSIVYREQEKTIIRPKIQKPQDKKAQQDRFISEFIQSDLPSYNIEDAKTETQKLKDGNLVFKKIFKKKPGVKSNEADVVEEIVETTAGVDETSVDVIAETITEEVQERGKGGKMITKMIRKTILKPKTIIEEKHVAEPKKVDEQPQEKPTTQIDTSTKVLVEKLIPQIDTKDFEKIETSVDGGSVLKKTFVKPGKKNVVVEKTVETSPEAANLSEDNIEVTKQVREIKEQLPDGSFVYREQEKFSIGPKTHKPFNPQNQVSSLITEFKSTNLSNYDESQLQTKSEILSDGNLQVINLYPKVSSKVEDDDDEYYFFEEIIEISYTITFQYNDSVSAFVTQQPSTYVLPDGTVVPILQRKTFITPLPDSNLQSQPQVNPAQSELSVFMKSANHNNNSLLFPHITSDQSSYSNFSNQDSIRKNNYSVSQSNEEFELGEKWSVINKVSYQNQQNKHFRNVMHRTVDEHGEIVEQLISEEYLSDQSLSSSTHSSLENLILSDEVEQTDGDFQALTVFTHTLEDDPVYETETSEYQDVLPDGTLVKRRVTKTNKTQSVVKRVILEGFDQDEPFSDLGSSTLVPITTSDQSFTRYCDHTSTEPEVNTDVQLSEEQLKDGTILRKRITNTKTQQLTTERLVVGGCGLFSVAEGGEDDVLSTLKQLSITRTSTENLPAANKVTPKKEERK